MLPALLGLVLLPFYSEALSTHEFGIIAAMGAISGVVTSFIDLSLSRASYRYYFDFSDNVERKKVLGIFFVGSNLAAILCFLTLIMLKPIVVLAYPEIDFYPYYFLTLATSAIAVSSNYIFNYFRMSQKINQYFFLSLASTLLQGLLIYYFVFYDKKAALGQIYALFFLSLILLPIYIGYAYKNFLFGFDWTLLKTGLSYSWPTIPGLLIAWILNWSNSLFIANYGTVGEVGLYAMAFKMASIFFVASGAYSVAFQPIFFRQANSVNQVSSKKYLASSIELASVCFIGLGFFLSLFSQDLVRCLLSEKYSGIYQIIRILLPAFVLPAILGISSNFYYMQSKKMKLELAVVSLSAFVSLLANFLLVKPFGIYGAAYATVISMCVMTLMSYQFSKKCYFVPVPWFKLNLLILTSIIVILFFQIYIEIKWYSLLCKISLTIFLSALFFYRYKINLIERCSILGVLKGKIFSK
jgi:O-antigen/teichoic acid export membrane protein